MNPDYYMEPERFKVGSNEGLRYDDPPLECAACGQVVCTIETGDDLAVLLMTANSHQCRARHREPAPCTSGLLTRDEVSTALNQAARQFRQVRNPDGIETGDTLAAGDDADLIVSLAGEALAHPGIGLDEAIHAAYADAGLDPDFDGLGLSVWNSHANDLGDHCPWSGQQATREDREALMSGVTDDRCPQGCQASGLEDPPQGSDLHKAAIVATVKERFS